MAYPADDLPAADSWQGWIYSFLNCSRNRYKLNFGGMIMSKEKWVVPCLIVICVIVIAICFGVQKAHTFTLTTEDMG